MKHLIIITFVFIALFQLSATQATLGVLEQTALSSSTTKGLRTLDTDGQYFYSLFVIPGFFSFRAEFRKFDSSFKQVGSSLDLGLIDGNPSISTDSSWVSSSVISLAVSVFFNEGSGAYITSIDTSTWRLISNHSLPYQLGFSNLMQIPNAPADTLAIFGYWNELTSAVYFYNLQTGSYTPQLNSSFFLTGGELVTDPNDKSSYGLFVAGIFGTNGNATTVVYDLSSGDLVDKLQLPTGDDFGVVGSGAVTWVDNSSTLVFYDLSSNSISSQVSLTNAAKYSNGQFSLYYSLSGITYVVAQSNSLGIWMVQYDSTKSQGSLVGYGDFNLNFNFVTLCDCINVQTNLYTILVNNEFTEIGVKS